MNTWSLALMPWIIHILFPEVNESRWNWDSDTKTTAHGMKGSLQSFGVIVGFTVLNNSLNHLKYLSAKLQRRDIDVFGAYTMIDNIKTENQCLRDVIGVEFQRWYDEAKQLSSYIGTEEELPRILRLAHVFFITIDHLAFLLLISYFNSCRTVSLQTIAGQ